VLRLLRGEDLETLSRELGVTAATLSGWRDQFLDGGAANLKAREADVDNEETQRLKSLVADLSMRNELLREKIHTWRPDALWSGGGRAMSRAASPFTERRYGLVRVTREWEMARSSFYHQREIAAHPRRALGRRGPKTAWSFNPLVIVASLILLRLGSIRNRLCYRGTLAALLHARAWSKSSWSVCILLHILAALDFTKEANV
jgi:hypothetical protein